MKINKRNISELRWVRGFVAFVAASSVVLLQGCATFGEEAPPEQLVQKRAQARWDALIAGQVEKAYGFNSPAYRDSVDFAAFKTRVASPPAKLKGAEVLAVKCEEASCDVTMRLYFVPLQPGFPELDTEHTERWILSDGKWWRFEKF